MEGDRKLKQWMLCLSVLILMMSGSTITLGAETPYRGSVTGLFGNDGIVLGSYQYTEKMGMTAEHDDGMIKAGVDYDFSDRFGMKVGINYDLDEESLIGYGGFDFSLPFGSNLYLNGFYDYNYKGEDWNRYETVIRIEMYKNQFLNAGVMGNTGSGAEIYDYNSDNEAMLFMRGDFSWQFRKFGINLRPVVMVKGEFLNDYNVTYQYNERTKLVLNINDLYDQEMNYRIGLEYKF